MRRPRDPRYLKNQLDPSFSKNASFYNFDIFPIKAVRCSKDPRCFWVRRACKSRILKSKRKILVWKILNNAIFFGSVLNLIAKNASSATDS